MKSYYLNTDLCLISRVDLSPLVESVRKKIELLHCGKQDKNWIAGFEAKGSGRPGKRKPQDDILRLLKVFGSLKGVPSALWKGCLVREMNVGWQASENRPEGYFQVEPDILLKFAEHGIILAVTVYPACENEK